MWNTIFNSNSDSDSNFDSDSDSASRSNSDIDSDLFSIYGRQSYLIDDYFLR